MPSPQTPQPVSVYVVGDTATVTFVLTVPGTPIPGSPVGQPPTYVDPGSATVRIQPPVSDPYTLTYGTDLAVTRVSAGVYRVTIPIGLLDHGRWFVRWHSTANGSGQGSGAREWKFEAIRSALTDPN